MSVKLDVDIRNRLANLAVSRKRTAHAIAREAVVAYVVREEAQDQANKEALEAWNDYQETGLHTTGDEVLSGWTLGARLTSCQRRKVALDAVFFAKGNLHATSAARLDTPACFFSHQKRRRCQQSKLAIIEALTALPNFPEGHKPVANQAHQRELLIKLGSLGYIARYRYERGSDIVVLRIRHQREDAFLPTDVL